ncbi:MAG TPA: heparinase II/III family protein [Clostridia bacterium]|nr:heparinase II/III family protein [Clostridia bacterium]
MLSDRFTDGIVSHIIPFNEYKPWPSITDREAWDSVDEEFRLHFLKLAGEKIKEDFMVFPASVLLKAGQTDVTTDFTRIKAHNDSILYTLVVAECLENKGRFLRHILDGVWIYLDLPTWHLPCPTAMYKRFPAAMVDVTDPLIELWSSAMVNMLSKIYYLLKSEFDRMDINIGRRIYSEIDRRIFTPYLERKDYWWMAYHRHYHKKMGVLYSINNFTPHCTNYVLESFLLIEENPQRRAMAVEKTMEVLDNYLNYIADDGWCDEGNGYWFMAYGALNLVLDKIRIAANGYVDVFDNEKIYKMGQYMCNAHIGNGYFVNFADAHPVNRMIGNMVIEYGMNTDNAGLKALAFNVSKRNDFRKAVLGGPVGFDKAFFVMFKLDDLYNRYSRFSDESDGIVTEHYYSDSEVLVARENKSYRGLYLACKGGHNDENHNHNDVGNFIVYKNAEPVLVDPGVESYIPDTFNKNRYKLWTMQSKYHNLATVNGVMQKETRRFKARNVEYRTDESSCGLSMSLKSAYEKSSGLIKYNRRVEFDRRFNQIKCTDDIELSEKSNDIEFSFMTPCRTSICNDTVVFYTNGRELARMEFESGLFNVSEEIIEFRDGKLSGEWNHYLKRLSFKINKPMSELKTSFIIS